MKVLILTDGITPFVIGGMQKHSFYLAKFLVLRGHEVTLVHCVPFGKTLPTQEDTVSAMELPEGHQLKSIALHFPQAGVMPGHYIKESYLYSKRVYDRVKGELDTFDFIYIKGFAGWHLLAEKAKGQKMPPAGIKFHGYEMFQPPASFKSRFHHWLLRGPVKWNSLKADYVFSYGGKITPIIESIGVSRDRIIEIPTGIESGWLVKNADYKQKQPVQFVFVGRFERRKGIEELNEALLSLLPAGGFHFHFIGPVPPSKKIKSESITYHGAVTDKAEMQRLLDQCQILVVPSHSEGMPNVIMEGMARSLAVIATDVGAVSVVVDSSNGWLIAPASVDELRAALQNAIECGPDVLNQKRRQSFEKVGMFFWENVIIRTENEISQRIAAQ